MGAIGGTRLAQSASGAARAGGARAKKDAAFIGASHLDGGLDEGGAVGVGQRGAFGECFCPIHRHYPLMELAQLLDRGGLFHQ